MARLLTVQECANFHGVTRAAIHAAIRRGALKANQEGRQWLVTEADCKAYTPLSDPRTRGGQGANVRWGTMVLDPSAETLPNPCVLTYEHEPPSDADIRRICQLNGERYTYIVATSSLQGQRANLAPSHQRSEKGKPLLAFNDYLRPKVKELFPLLTRAEERILLRRSIGAIGRTEDLRMRLEQDMRTLGESLSNLAAQEIWLTNEFPAELSQSIVHPELCDVLANLQDEYHKLQQQQQKWAFEAAARHYLQEQFIPTPIVVIEGFTYLTPLQEFYVQRCVEQGAQVYFLHPYREEQAACFAALKRTYEPFEAAIPIETPPVNRPEALSFVQQSFGSPQETPRLVRDTSVQINAATHRHREVEVCIREIKALLAGSAKADDIAIVVRDRAVYEPLLREEAALQGLNVTLGIPPRRLLLTPVGRFVLTLYEIWQEGRLEMNPEQFETLLASGWLGAHLQATCDQFTAVSAQLFSRCRTLEEWNAHLIKASQLRKALSPESRLPVGGIDSNAIALWEEALSIVVGLCERLFSLERGSIGEHVGKLLDELSKIDPWEMQRAEREIVQRIQEELEEVALSTSLPMSAQEFGTVLNSLVREYGNPDDGEAPERKPDHIWVTTPEGIDNSGVDQVFYLGIDDLHAPRPYQEPWPFFDLEVQAHSEKERYFFLSVLRAARRRLILSYAQSDEAGTYSPSPYLVRVANLLNDGLKPPTPAIATTPTPSVPELRPTYFRRTTYDISEIAHYRLCPARLKFERIDDRARRYRDPFQLRFIAQGTWLELIMEKMEKVEPLRGSDKIIMAFNQAMDETEEEARAIFPGMRDLEWQTCRKFLNKNFAWLANSAKGYEFQIRPTEAGKYVIPLEGRQAMVLSNLRWSIQKGIVHDPYDNDIFYREWLLPAKEEDAQEYLELEGGVRVFANKYQAVAWWRKALHSPFKKRQAELLKNSQRITAAQQKVADTTIETHRQLLEEIATVIQQIEAGHFPKNPGQHCLYCSVRTDCLGL